MARDARLDVVASASVGSLTGGSATLGGGYASRMNWVPESDQPLTYSASWPITHIRWNQIGLTLMPASNGVLTVDLLGQWEMSPDGSIYCQEVLWDVITAEGATITNGSFEVVSGGVPVGWSNPWGGAVALESPAVDGTNSVAVWHDRRLRTAVAVTGGQEVTLRAWARARVPADFVDNPRLSSTDTPAHRAARRFMRGVNFSNYFEAPAGEDWGGGPLSASDFDAVRAEGFDHVRLPVSWNYHTGPAPEYVISNAFFARVDALVTGLLARGVNVLLNEHHFGDFYSNPAAWSNKLFAIWDQLAAHYSNQTDALAFEIINEPNDAATTELMNGVYAAILPRIRASNPQRTIFVGPGKWNGVGELSDMRLPANDSNLIVTVHNYAPFYFTHQGAEWTGTSTATTNVVYPGPPPAPVSPHPAAAGDSGVASWFEAYNTLPLAENPCSSNSFDGAFQFARAWSDYYGRPVHVGEFGAYSRGDAASRARFYREMRESMDRNGLGWASWDWKSGFFYWDRNANAPGPGLRNSFFPAPDVRASGSVMRIQCDAAVGKKLIVQRADAGVAQWTGVYTQIQVVPQLDYNPDIQPSGGIFRIVWDRL